MISRLGSEQSTAAINRAGQVASGPAARRAPESGTRQTGERAAAVVRIGTDARARAAASDQVRAATEVATAAEARPELQIEPVVTQPVPDFYSDGGRGDDSGYNAGASNAQASQAQLAERAGRVNISA